MFLKGQGHLGIFFLVKGTLRLNCKFVLEHFKGIKALTRGHRGYRLCCLREVSGLILYHRLEKERETTRTCNVSTQPSWITSIVDFDSNSDMMDLKFRSLNGALGMLGTDYLKPKIKFDKRRKINSNCLFVLLAQITLPLSFTHVMTCTAVGHFYGFDY